jgi:hypothetical protein
MSLKVLQKCIAKIWIKKYHLMKMIISTLIKVRPNLLYRHFKKIENTYKMIILKLHINVLKIKCYKIIQKNLLLTVFLENNWIIKSILKLIFWININFSLMKTKWKAFLKTCEALDKWIKISHRKKFSYQAI